MPEFSVVVRKSKAVSFDGVLVCNPTKCLLRNAQDKVVFEESGNLQKYGSVAEGSELTLGPYRCTPVTHVYIPLHPTPPEHCH